MQQIYIECYQILEEIINRYAPNDGDKCDLLQDLILEVMEKNQKFIKKLYESLKNRNLRKEYETYRDNFRKQR